MVGNDRYRRKLNSIRKQFVQVVLLDWRMYDMLFSADMQGPYTSKGVKFKDFRDYFNQN